MRGKGEGILPSQSAEISNACHYNYGVIKVGSKCLTLFNYLCKKVAHLRALFTDDFNQWLVLRWTSNFYKIVCFITKSWVLYSRGQVQVVWFISTSVLNHFCRPVFWPLQHKTIMRTNHVTIELVSTWLLVSG